jgi:hypothetical protein
MLNTPRVRFPHQHPDKTPSERALGPRSIPPPLVPAIGELVRPPRRPHLLTSLMKSLFARFISEACPGPARRRPPEGHPGGGSTRTTEKYCRHPAAYIPVSCTIQLVYDAFRCPPLNPSSIVPPPYATITRHAPNCVFVHTQHIRSLVLP